jgi:metal-responsive CopG/Arc/MetJ family transcriptional regulator
MFSRTPNAWWRRTKKSRSKLFSEALREYVARHAGDEVTDAMNRVCAQLGTQRDEFASTASRRVLERSEW